jgi:serine/threonine protein kinase
MARIVIGDVIAGKYCVERAIAEGSTGTIFAARHLELDQPVAIKVLFEEVAARSVAAERFRREARAAARMQGPHVCRVLDIGAQPDGTPFMVMEYLEGCHLGRELERRGRLTPEEAFECILQACDAVAEAHAAGIVHRDLKPANLFWAVLPDGSRHMKVLGFGVSKALAGSRSGESAITMGSTITGAPAYLSPEQLDSSQDIDERTDIWSLAVVFYELISGRVPFYGESIPALVRAVLSAKPKALSELQVGAPPGLDAVLEKALSKRREQRYGSIAEFVSALVPFAPISAADTAQDVRKPYAGRISRAQTLNRMHLYGVAQREGEMPAAEPISPEASSTAGASSARSRFGAIGVGFLLAVALGVLAFRWAGVGEERPREVLAPQPTAAETSIQASSQEQQPAAPAQLNIVRPAALATGAALADPSEAPVAAGEELPIAITPEVKPPLPAAAAPKPQPGAAAHSAPRLYERPAPPLTDFGGRR